ncbi:MAG: hypothetical protein RR677_11745 [Acinetobacter sp.]
MDDKKIFKILQHWFPELLDRKIPKKKKRKDFEEFLGWLVAEKVVNHLRAYVMKIDRHTFHENEIERSAVFQDHHLDSQHIQSTIRLRAKPILEHFEKHKSIIGRYYNVQDQVFDIVFEEILTILKLHNFELLLIYADDYYWLAVPNQDHKIEKFCKHFNKQFHDEDITIEHYALFDCSRST